VDEKKNILVILSLHFDGFGYDDDDDRLVDRGDAGSQRSMCEGKNQLRKLGSE